MNRASIEIAKHHIIMINSRDVLLSRTTIYAVRAAIHLSEQGGGEALRAGDIAEAVDSYPLDGRCLLGREECSDADPCAAHDRWRSVADRITSFVNDTTLAQFGRHSNSRPSASQRRKRGKS
jgi:DNA-binding IscR family transcriptional regulator